MRVGDTKIASNTPSLLSRSSQVTGKPRRFPFLAHAAAGANDDRRGYAFAGIDQSLDVIDKE
jgi:hypothetical protein